MDTVLVLCALESFILRDVFLDVALVWIKVMFFFFFFLYKKICLKLPPVFLLLFSLPLLICYFFLF